MILRSDSPQQTIDLAATLARSLTGGECLALHGDLGAGKTQFVRGLTKGMGGDASGVSSPTYVLLHIYDTGRLTIYHLDAYRIGGADDFEQIGFAELCEQPGVVVVEWADRIESLLPPDTIHIRLTPVGKAAREIHIDPTPRGFAPG